MTTPIDELAGIVGRRQAAYDALPAALGREPDDEDYALVDAIEEAMRLAARSTPVPAANVSEGLREALSAEEEAEMRSAHVQTANADPDNPRGWCAADDFGWPCDTAIVLTTLDVARALAATPVPAPSDPFRDVVDGVTGGCGCGCHTGIGYNTSCVHCRATPAPALDRRVLWSVLAGIGVLDNGTWVSFTEADMATIADAYAAEAARLATDPKGERR